MKKVYFILIITVSVLLSFCRNYDKPVLILPQKNDTIPVVSGTIDNKFNITNKVNVFLSDSNKTLNFSVNFNDTLNTTVYFGIPFYPKVAKYYFLNNMKPSPTVRPSHFFGYQNKDSSKDTCLNFVPFNWGLSPYFAQVSVDDINVKNGYYVFSGNFSLNLIRKCNSGSDTLIVKDVSFKNITIF